MYGLEKYLSGGNLKVCEWQSKHWGLSRQRGCQPIAICRQQISFDSLLVWTHDPVGRHFVTGVKLRFGYAVTATCGRRENPRSLDPERPRSLSP